MVTIREIRRISPEVAINHECRKAAEREEISFPKKTKVDPAGRRARQLSN